MKLFGNKETGRQSGSQSSANSGWDQLAQAPNDKFNAAIEAVRQQNQQNQQNQRNQQNQQNQQNQYNQHSQSPEQSKASSPNSLATFDDLDRLPATTREQLLAVNTPFSNLQKAYPYAPLDSVGDLLISNLRDRQALRLVGVLGDRRTAFSNNEVIYTPEAFNNTAPAGHTFIDFLHRYPTPMDFEPIAETFIANEISNKIDPEGKKNEYRAAAKALMKFAYGDRYDAYEKAKQAAANNPLNSPSNPNSVQARRARAEAAQGSNAQAARSESRQSANQSPAAAEAHNLSPDRAAELDRNRRLGVVYIPRAMRGAYNRFYSSQYQANHEIGRSAQLSVRFESTDAPDFHRRAADPIPSLERPIEPSADAYFIDDSKHFYGVFDGANGEGGAREASAAAAKSVANSVNKYRFETPDDLRWALDQASQDVLKDPTAGITTGVLANIVTDASGQRLLNYASIGDSRLYVIPKGDSQAYLCTHDEVHPEHGNVILNSLGGQKFDAPGRVASNNYGQLKVRPGDRILLCSDGLTGDTPAQNIDNLLGPIVASATSARAAAEALAAQSLKKDDLTALVITVE